MTHNPQPMTNKTFKIITLGCKVNQYESAYFEEALIRAGWQPAMKGKPARVVLINTCIVTQKASHQSRQAIRKAIREHPGAYVAAVGCYAQVFPEELAQIEGVDLIADNRMKAQVPHLIAQGSEPARGIRMLRPFEPDAPFDTMAIRHFAGRTRAYLKIQDGCRSYCSYCIVPFARGPYRSLGPEDVVSMLKTLSEEGYREVVLTGIHLGKYGVDLKGEIDLLWLLKRVGREALPLRIRLSSMEPNELATGLIEMAATEPWLCRHFHIPLQSGDDGVLKNMNRPYGVREFVRRIDIIHRTAPDAAVGVDIMAGFPGEDKGAFENSYSLLDELPISYLHVFPFSPRPGTAASRLTGKISPEIIKERAARLRALGERKRHLFYQRCLNKEFLVLAERRDPLTKKWMQGTSDNYLPVLFPQSRDSVEGLVPVRAERVERGRVIGTVVYPGMGTPTGFQQSTSQ